MFQGCCSPCTTMVFHRLKVMEDGKHTKRRGNSANKTRKQIEPTCNWSQKLVPSLLSCVFGPFAWSSAQEWRAAVVSL